MRFVLLCWWQLWLGGLAAGAWAQSAVRTDSLGQAWQQAKSDTAKIRLAQELCNAFVFSQPDSAVRYAQWGLKNARPGRDDRRLHTFHNALGVVRNQQADYNKAIMHHFAALELAQKFRDGVNQGRSLNNIGVVFTNQGKYTRALVYFHEAQKVYEKAKEFTFVNTIHTNVGIIHQNLKHYDQARESFQKAIRGHERNRNRRGTAIALQNLARFYYLLAKYDSAMHFFEQAEHIYREIGEKSFLGRVYKSKGAIRVAFNQLDQAEADLKYGFSVATEVKDRKTQAQVQIEMANLRLKQHRPDEAAQLARQALATAEEIQSMEEIKLAAALVSDIYFQLEDYGQALSYYKVARTAQDSLDNVERQKAISNLQSDFEIQSERKQREEDSVKNRQMMQLLRSRAELRQRQLLIEKYQLNDSNQLLLAVTERTEKEYDSLKQTSKAEAEMQQSQLIFQKQQFNLQQAELRNKQQQRNLLMVSLALVLSVVAVLVWAYYQNRRKNRELAARQAELQRLNATKDKLFSIVAHDLRAPFNGLKNSLELFDSQYISQTDFTHLANLLKQDVEGLNQGLDNLLRWAHSQMQGIEPQPLSVELGQKVDEVLQLYARPAADKNIDLINQVPIEVKAWVDPDHVRLLLRNLVNNAIKFTPAGGSVRVGATVGARTKITICDTGLGMTADEIGKLFNIEQHYSTRGTANEKGSGLGLILCKEFVEANQGQLTVESQKGKGTTFTIDLPLSN
ncbi:MAG: tetratricopeptide repeat protein [Bernardetiaceae bacterium]|jgi:signal transduction histidine kinase|nr:tetratricopeptide repeat protein [Bernardetiaceae bacterium]